MHPQLLSQIPPLYNPAINAAVGDFANPDESLTAFQLILRNILTMAFIIAGLWFFVQLILGGYNYMTAGGDKEAVQKAQRRIQNAFIGLVLILAVYAISHVMNIVFGFQILIFNIPRP